MPLVDRQIVELANQGFITPFNKDRLNSMGYDLSLGEDFRVPILDSEVQIVDPFSPPKYREERHADRIIIPAGRFVLGISREFLRMPKDVIGICLGRSTYARSGIISHVTPLEPGWNGFVTIEISNTHPLPVIVYVDKGITQMVLFRGEEVPIKDYEAKGGRYQNQMGLTLGRPDR